MEKVYITSYVGGEGTILPSMDGKGNHPLFLKDTNLEEGIYRKKERNCGYTIIT